MRKISFQKFIIIYDTYVQINFFLSKNFKLSMNKLKLSIRILFYIVGIIAEFVFKCLLRAKHLGLQIERSSFLWVVGIKQLLKFL